MRIVFMGTPDFAAKILECLAAWPGGKIAAVYTRPDKAAGRGNRPGPSAVKTAARSMGIPVFQPAGLKNDADAVELEAVAADVLVVAAYGPERLLEKAGEVEILISQEGQMNTATTGAILSRDIYQPLMALKTGRVYRVPEELISRPTPSLLEGLDIMAAQIRGEVPHAR